MDRSGLCSHKYSGIQLTFIEVKLQGLFAYKALAEERVYLRSLEDIITCWIWKAKMALSSILGLETVPAVLRIAIAYPQCELRVKMI